VWGKEALGSSLRIVRVMRRIELSQVLRVSLGLYLSAQSYSDSPVRLMCMIG